MVRDWPRDPFPRQQSFPQQCYPHGGRHPPFDHERYASDQEPFTQERYSVEGGDGARFQDPYDVHRRQPPMVSGTIRDFLGGLATDALIQQIDEALRLHYGIAGKQYFVVAVNDEGAPMTFFSPGQKLHDHTVRQFFDASKFQQVISRINSGADPMLDDEFAFDDGVYGRQGILARARAVERRRSSVLDDWGSPARQGRKRPRARHPVNEDNDVPMTVSSRRGIKVGDSEAVWSFYERRPAQEPAYVSQAVQLSPAHSFMTSSFEGSSRPDYDTNGNAIFRAADLPQTPVSQQQGYYVPGDGRGSLRVMPHQAVEGAVSRNAVQ